MGKIPQNTVVGLVWFCPGLYPVSRLDLYRLPVLRGRVRDRTTWGSGVTQTLLPCLGLGLGWRDPMWRPPYYSDVRSRDVTRDPPWPGDSCAQNPGPPLLNSTGVPSPRSPQWYRNPQNFILRPWNLGKVWNRPRSLRIGGVYVLPDIGCTRMLAQVFRDPLSLLPP